MELLAPPPAPQCFKDFDDLILKYIPEEEMGNLTRYLHAMLDEAEELGRSTRREQEH